MTSGLLRPGSDRLGALTSDEALVSAMVDVESAWLAVLGLPSDLEVPDSSALSPHLERAGNPVVPLLAALRDKAPAQLHKGLTSQDTLDSALMLMTQTVRRRVIADAEVLCAELARLAADHRDSLMVGRTLTQTAVPITFGLKVAQWLVGVREAMDGLASLPLPVQCGGAAGTLSLIAELTDARTAPEQLAARLGLDVPELPWHTRSRPVTAIGDAITTLTDALGTMATDICLLSRTEIGEVSEGAGGTSSTMPHKRNPVLSVLIRSAALQAPVLAAGLHTAAGQMVDERPDGAWHAQWPLYRDLLELALIATSQARDLIAGLVIHSETMRRRAMDNSAELLAERYGKAGVPADADPSDHLGQAGTLVDTALTRTYGEVTLAFTPLTPSRPDAPLLVVGAGLGTSVSTLWGPVSGLLDGVEVVGVDLPGHGRSPAASDTITVARLAQAIRRWVHHNMPAQRRVYYAGVSLAGAVALELALRPEPFDAVVCIASTARLGTPLAWRERATLVGRAGTSVMVAGSAQRWFAAGFTDSHPQLAGAMLDDLVEVDDRSYSSCCEALATYDLRQELCRAAIPVVLVPGDLDVVVSVSQAEVDAARLPQARVAIAQGAAHQPPVEVPEQIAQLLQEVVTP
mgnify:CR=1 FL=1